MFVVVWAVGGLGRPGLLLRKAAGCCSCFSLVWRGWGWLVAVCWCRRHARCCLFWWWWVLSRACLCACVGVACCRGSGVVRPGCLACFSAACFVGGGVWVWVGWL